MAWVITAVEASPTHPFGSTLTLTAGSVVDVTSALL